MNKDKKETPSIFLATPMYGGNCTGIYAQSVLNLQKSLQEKGWSFELSAVMNDALIQRARNYLVKCFMDSGFTHLLFIDADISFNPQDVIKMIEEDKDIICGIYTKKVLHWDRIQKAANVVPLDFLPIVGTEPVFVLLDEDNPTVEVGNYTKEILYGGTGYMLIKKDVFEQLSQITPKYRNNTFQSNVDEYIHNFFGVEIDEKTNTLLSEDWFFCDSWKKNGGKIHLAAWATARHSGTFIFG